MEKKIKYCSKCIMPDTRPGIYFDERGVCAGCIAEERKDLVDWGERKKELEKLCDKYRREDGEYDCIIAVSGGKDSHFQIYVMKEVMGLNPLLVSVFDNFKQTEAGKHNIKNISEEFGCDILMLKPNIKAQKIAVRYCFENYAKPTYIIDRLIYAYPLHIAMKFNIPLVVFGENISFEYGGPQIEETPSALEQMHNGAASGIPMKELFVAGIPMKEMVFLRYPTLEEMKEKKLEPIYLSYFYRWNDYANYIFAKSRGFKDLVGEWRRTHQIDDYTQVDSYAYDVHYWLKYPKFGHQYATDLISRFIRYGLMTKEEGIELVRKHDHNLDQKAVVDFCDFCGYSLTEFYEIVNKFYNRELFRKDKFGRWILRHPIWGEDKQIGL